MNRSEAVIGVLMACAVFGGGFLAGSHTAPPPPAEAPRATAPSVQIPPAAGLPPTFDGRTSLFYIPFDEAVNDSPEGGKAARHILAWLDGAPVERLDQALQIYEQLVPKENFGGEYPTLEWFCRYAKAGEDEQKQMLEDDDARRFVAYFSPDEWSRLQTYLRGKYGIERRMRMDEFRWVDELLRFNSPRRKDWEQTDAVMQLLAPKPGDRVADIGAGSGFYSFRLAKVVGAEGHVTAVEMNERHIDYVRGIARAEGIANLTVEETDGTTVPVPDHSLDLAFMCSTYQAIYATIREEPRTAFIESLKRSLKPDGRLVLSENDPVDRTGNPYRGISIGPEVVIAQLQAYGFELVSQERFIPQRYLLTFRLAAAGD